MRVGIDIDDVLYPWYDVAHRVCDTAGITNGATPTSWAPYEQYGCTDQAWFDALAIATLTGELYGAPPIAGVREQLERLHDAGHTIHLVTARGFLQHGKIIRLDTIEWINEYGIPHDSLTFIKDKRLVDVDAFIDDAPHNYDQLAEHGFHVWLLHAPHNVHARTGRDCVATLEEFVDLILGLDPAA